MLPPEAINRALWPWERDYIEATNYIRESERREKSTSQWMQTSFDRLSKADAQASSALSNDGATQWVKCLDNLVSSQFEKTEQAITDANKRRESTVENNPYQVPFNTLATNFLHHLHKHHRHQFADDRLPAIYSMLADWYVSSAIRCSRYALHVTYKQSKMAWEEWARQFELPASTCNPWPDIVTEYPVLLRRLSTIQQHASDALGELLMRLDSDRSLLLDRFNIPIDAKLSVVQPGLSDPHRLGRTVCKIVFNDASTLYYKPKPVDIESAFNDFIAKKKPVGLRHIKVLPRSSYGWVEAAEHQMEMEPLAFPESVGAATACFWLLNATDLHVENILTDASGVLAVDLETLLTAPIGSLDSHQENSWRRHSINATLLFNAQVGTDRHLSNISGFNASPDSSSTMPQVNFILRNDDIQLITAPHNSTLPGLPRLADQKEKDAVHNVITSFRNALTPKNIALYKEFLSTVDAGCQLRFVPRATNFYVQLLERMSQPRLLRDASTLARDLFSLHNAVQTFSDIGSTLHAIVDDEISQLLKGDVPYFYTKAGHTHIYTSTGCLTHFFSSSGIANATKKLNEFEQSDVDEQSVLLAISLGDRHAYHPKVPSQDGLSIGSSIRSSHSDVQNLLDLATHIVDGSFQPSHEPARWLSLYGDVSGKDLRAEAGDRAFFGGAWGILLALQAVTSSISNSTNTSVLSDFLDRQALLWQHELERTDSTIQSLGFAGFGGDLFSQSQLIELDENRWGYLSLSVKNRLSQASLSIKDDSWLDVIGGTAGLLLGCTKLRENDLSPDINQAVEDVLSIATTHLVASITESDAGPAWLVPGERLPLLGYAHGWAGIVVALSSASRYCDLHLQRSISDCLNRTKAYPESLYMSYGQWFDHRSAKGKSTSVPNSAKPLDHSWCNGAPGLLRGLLELDLNNETLNEGTSTLTKAARNALSNSKAYRFCCGEMGSVDLLLDLGVVTNNKDDYSMAVKRGKEIVKNTMDAIHQKAEREVPELIFPGLFQGLSGIAYCGARTFRHQLPSLSGQSLRTMKHQG